MCRLLCSTYATFIHAAGMVQTRTFRIDAVDLVTGKSVVSGGNHRGAIGGSDGDQQQRFLVPVIDLANHSTLEADVNAELRLAACAGDGLRFALVARGPRQRTCSFQQCMPDHELPVSGAQHV